MTIVKHILKTYKSPVDNLQIDNLKNDHWKIDIWKLTFKQLKIGYST